MKLHYKVLLAFVILVGVMIWNMSKQEGVNDLSGDFNKVTMFRNENNTGPIQRVYIVTTSDTLWTEMRTYGDFMLHTKLGNTKVYFFSEGSPVPKRANSGGENFDSQFNTYCLAKYEKNASGLVTFNKFPFLK